MKTNNKDVDENGNLSGFDSQILHAETRIEQAGTRTEQAKTRIEQAETRIEQAETRTEAAEMRTEQAKTRIEQAETRTEAAEIRMEAVEIRSAQAILVSELRYRRLFETMQDGILILDADTGQVVDANPFMKELLGYSLAEFVGKKLWEIGPFRGEAASKITFAELQRTDRIHYEGLPLETKEGRRVEVEFISNAYLVDQKKVIQCNIRDITERKQCEDQLKNSFKEVSDLKFALDQHAIVSITDSQGIITYANDKFCAVSKYDRAELLGQDHRLINSGHHPKEFIRDLWLTIEQGRVWHGEFKNKAKDGSFYWVNMTIVPFLNDEGKPRQYVSIRTEITKRKAAEEKVFELNAELEQRVGTRTAELQTVNAELETFSYSVSHDLRAPLRHVLGFVTLLQNEARPALAEKDRRYLDTIAQSARRMGDLIDDLLAFSRVGRSALEKADIHLDELVLEVVGDFEAETKARTIAWQIHPLPVVQADRALLRLVLVNLISNAVKFTGQRAEARIEIGEVTSKIETKKAESGNEAPVSALPISTVSFSPEATVVFIRDNGAGFDPQYAGKLFGVFQRLHSQEEFEGTGIGLANVQRIIQRHGGRVWAEGVVDGGATFYFSIPKPNGGSHAS